jgi:Na+/melibiose symporter-like transporter
MKKMSLPRMIVLNTYWIGLSFMWNALHPIILPAVLLNYVPDARKNTYLGLLTFAGLIIAMIIQPLSGAISDNWRSRWGRRRPLIVLGTLFDFVFLSLLAWAGGFTWLIIGYIGLQFSSNIAHAPVQGLLPDLVPNEQLGVASSLKTFMDMLSLIIASLIAGRLMDPGSRDPGLIVAVVIGLLAVSMLVMVLGTREAPTDRLPRAEQSEGFFEQFRIDLRAHKSYWWVIGERGVFLLGIFGVQAFVQYYLQDVLRVPDPPRQTGDLLAALTVSLLVLVLIGGWLVDKYGAKKILYAGSLLAAAGMLIIMPIRTMSGLLMAGSVLGAGMGLFLTANWALSNKLVPVDQAGKYLGLSNLATAGSGALARLEGPALDWLNGLWPGQWVGYTAMFLFGAVCMILSVILLLPVKESR